MRTIAIIPARGGSKGIPHKNIVSVGGKPLIAWTIEAARRSTLLDRVLVTTDSAAIAEIARNAGAEVPFLRPAELAQDDTPGIAPLLHAVAWLTRHDHDMPDAVMLLQPTSPLRTEADIDAALRLLQAHAAEAVVSVAPPRHHPYWMKQLTPEGRLTDFVPHDPAAFALRQDLPPVYVLNGAIYLVQRTVLLQRQTFYTDQTYAYVMPPERSLDVDTPWDLFLIDLILQERQRHETH